jgi:hypothetical protein
MWRVWFHTLPFYRLLCNFVGNMAMVLPASHSFWGLRYPQLCGPSCNDVIEKYKFVSEIMGQKILREWILTTPFYRLRNWYLITGKLTSH